MSQNWKNASACPWCRSSHTDGLALPPSGERWDRLPATPLTWCSRFAFPRSSPARWTPSSRRYPTPTASPHSPVFWSNVCSSTRGARSRLSSRSNWAIRFARRPAPRARGAPVPQIEVDSRYHWIAQVVEATVRQPLTAGQSWTDRIDQVVTHKVWGLVVFLVVMAMTFQAIFSWAVPLMGGLDALFNAIGTQVGSLLPDGPLRSLVVDGLIGGVGAVVVFVPQIAVLFGLIALLEDSGYMARAAFLMDRVMASFGLSGRSFIPLLSSFACAVPGTLAPPQIAD